MNTISKLAGLSVLVAGIMAAAWYSNMIPGTREHASADRSKPAVSTTAETASGHAAAPERDAPAISDLRLLSIYPATDQDDAAVIIMLGENTADLFNEGSDVYGIATLEVISVDHVVLQTDNGPVRLYAQEGNGELAQGDMPEDGESTTPGRYGTHRELQHKLQSGELSVMSILQDAAAGGQYQSSKKATLYRKQEPRGQEDRRAVFEKARSAAISDQSDMAWAFLDYEPEMRQDGIAGVRLTGHEELELLNRHGLEYGDVITGVNGRKIDSQAAMMEAMELIGSARHLELTVERGSQNETISIDK